MNLRLVLSLVLLPSISVTGFGQSIPEKGTGTTFDLATWNIEWFGGPNGPSNDEQQILNVLDVFRSSGIDMWALQEIADASDFTRLLDSLGSNYSGFLATESSEQKIGFLYNTEVVRLISQSHILTSFDSDFATRPPLQMKAEITIGDSSQVVTFITIHMKAFSDLESYNKRKAASGRLKNHIDFTTLEDEPVVILGDFNDELASSITFGQDSPYENFLMDPDDYFFATQEMEQDGRNTWCSNFSCTSGSTIDHILLTNEFLPYLVASSTDHYDELLDAINSYSSTTSDHLPAFARFDLNRVSAIENDLPGEQSTAVSYPNPFSDTFSLRRNGIIDPSARASVFDITGRRVLEVSLGSQPEFKVDLTGYPSGVYFVQVTSRKGLAALRVVKL
ncbi:MAG: T9SS type A sorting domain-containing protein [Rhodothermales bacterium]|nr:T9SS type A sorting domain-containing protein [Rhodothermales bacterium]